MTPARPAASLLLSFMLASTSAGHAGVELELLTGRVLKGLSWEVDDGLYLLTLEGGQRLAIPVPLVVDARPDDDDLPGSVPVVETDRIREVPVSEFVPSVLMPPDPDELLPDEKAIGLLSSIELPKTFEQLAAFGEPRAPLARPVIAPQWAADSDWDDDLEHNYFDTSSWSSRSPGTRWRPQGTFTPRDDVTQFNPSRWYRVPFRSRWRPDDDLGN